MKIARFLPVSVIGLVVSSAAVVADPPPVDYTDTAPNPYLVTDPDGVPLNLTQKHDQPLTQDQLDALHKEQQRAQQDKNWLLRNYERQMQTHSILSQGQQSNIYYELGSNKELAKLAGVPLLDDDGQANSSTSQTGISPAVAPSVALRQDASEKTEGGFSPRTDMLSPLVRPLTGPGSMQSSFSALPFAMPSPLSGNYLPQIAPAPARTPDESLDSSDLAMPGMVAAKNSSLTDPTDDNLDVLPGETLDHARAHQDNNSLLELPLPMDADQLHKSQAEALSVATPDKGPQALKATPPPNVNAKPIEDPEAPIPVSKSLPINPVRAPIANPYDILNR